MQPQQTKLKQWGRATRESKKYKLKQNKVTTTNKANTVNGNKKNLNIKTGKTNKSKIWRCNYKPLLQIK